MMSVASLVDKCLQVGIPVDIANLTRESKGWTRDHVLELRLEQLLMARVIAVRTFEAMNFQKQLEQASKKLEEKEKKITSQKDEIRKLKSEIRKMRRKGSGFSEDLNESIETDDKDCDTFDLSQGQIVCTSGTGSYQFDDGGPRPAGSSYEEHAHYHESQGGCGTSGFGPAHGNLQLFQGHSSGYNVTDNRDYYEDTGSSQIQPDKDEKEEWNERSPQSDAIHIPGSKARSSSAAQVLPSFQRPSTAFDEEMDISSDISSPPGSNSIFEQSGGSNVPNTNPAELLSCSRCLKLYKSQEGLKLHIFSIHSNEPGVFKCEKCHYGYFSERELHRHYGRHRKQGNPKWSCPHCPQLFYSRSVLYTHQQMHLGKNGTFERPICGICGSSYASIYSLRAHQKNKHSRQN